MNTANWIPDLFMKRMEDRQPLDALPLQRSPGPPQTSTAPSSRRRYVAYEKPAPKKGEIFGKEIPALELWKQDARR
jgi:ribonucleoside-diphosphate reductase alpha chain